MLSIRGSLTLILLVWPLASTRPTEGWVPADTPEKVNTGKKSLDGVVLFTATIAPESRESEPASLSLQLKNLGMELLVFNDRPMETFSVKVKKKDGALLPATRYLKELMDESKRRHRDVLIELPQGE